MLQTQWFSERCIGCNTCLQTCPNGCLSRAEDGSLLINRKDCQACGTCAQACPTGALEAVGRTVTVNELFAELRKDRAYYDKSGGGVTLSGGEPTFQPDFAERLLYELKEEGIHTALDTCGLCPARTLERLLPCTDLVLFDLKLLEPGLHVQFTGVPNQQILESLTRVREYQRSQTRPFELWIRTPLIPEATATDENINAIGRYLNENLNGSVSRWELCAFNNLCRDQYRRLGMEWDYALTPLMTAGELAHYEQIGKYSGFCPELVHATGATRVVEQV
jgi:pyruvate formate lyase activating enzyme